MSTTSHLDEQMDGRTARAVRTRDGIVDACLDLIDEGDVRPTGPRIAERAGVSVRSIFQHFDDPERLFSAVGERVSHRIARLVAPIDADLPTDDRVDAYVQQRAAVLESLAPVLRAAMVYKASSEVITRQFADGHAFFREHLEQVFAPELDAAPDRVVALDALVAVTSWPCWELWRTAQGRSTDDARRVMAWSIRAALTAARG